MFTLIGWSIALLGWVIVIAIILSLTGLQKKLFKMAGQSGGHIVSKKFNIPFIGTATVESIAGEKLKIELERKKK
ncbi:MAG: hypothetical protein M0R17_05070 [Candidatus Omnitrophica bacterium]|jgi:hypothetical protein|nr:hypothetical protein [Candidatus Omnitrophota bacterium]